MAGVEKATAEITQLATEITELSDAIAAIRAAQAESGGVVGMLEVILSDFARLETQTSVAEETNQAAYEKFMAESDEDIAVKDAEMKHKENAKARTEEKL